MKCARKIIETLADKILAGDSEELLRFINGTVVEPDSSHRQQTAKTLGQWLKEFASWSGYTVTLVDGPLEGLDAPLKPDTREGDEFEIWEPIPFSTSHVKPPRDIHLYCVTDLAGRKASHVRFLRQS